MTVLFLVLTLVIVFLVSRGFGLDLYKRYKLKITSPKSYAIIGHYHKYFGLKSKDAFNVTNEFSTNFPEMCKSWQFHNLAIFINNPELIEKVLTSKKCQQRPLFLLKFFDINEGLLSSRYQKWVLDRKYFNQFFNTNMLRSYVDAFTMCGDKLVEKFNNLDDTDLDLLPHLEVCATEAICCALFGMEVNDSRIVQIYNNTSIVFESLYKTFEAGLLNPLRFLSFIHKMTSDYKNVRKSHEILNQIQLQIRSERMKDETTKSMFDHLSCGKFTEKQIREHYQTFLNAGFDTTSAELNYICIFLAMHKDIQDNLFEEISNYTEEGINYETVTKMELLDRVVNESLRLAPPVFLVGRETVDDFEILPDCVIPKGTTLTINTFTLHRRKDIWGEHADKFNPNNFLPDRVRHPYSYLPFSKNSKNCIGYRYTIIFIKVIVIKLLTNFKFSTFMKYEDLEFKYGMTLKLDEPCVVSIKKRK